MNDFFVSICRHCNKEISRYTKPPEGFETQEDPTTGWGTDYSGDPKSDFYCPARENSAYWPDGKPHEPIPQKYFVVRTNWDKGGKGVLVTSSWADVSVEIESTVLAGGSATISLVTDPKITVEEGK